jgi:DNA-binding NtrC family response regulator
MFFDVLQNPASVNEARFRNEQPMLGDFHSESGAPSIAAVQPMVLRNNNTNNDISQHQEVEESLSIVDAEKDLIIKALKKHRGKRRDAASDLGISERTLYRKLKEYNINE